MDGYEVCRRFKASPPRAGSRDLLDGKVDPADEERGFGVGAVDFIHKPDQPACRPGEVRTHLENQKWRNFLENKNAWLEREVESRIDQINRLQDASLQTMIELAEFRDECTGNHVRRTQRVCTRACRAPRSKEHHRECLRPETIRHIVQVGPSHDIGKICIPDHILLKKGPLDATEFAIMRTHAERDSTSWRKSDDI